MDKSGHHKSKDKKSAKKTKPSKKKNNEGPTCSMFLADLTRKLALKKKQEEQSPKNIVDTIIDSITNALPFKFSRRSPPKNDSPMKIETLQKYAPELLPNDTLNIPPTPFIANEDLPNNTLNILPNDFIVTEETMMEEVESAHTSKPGFKMPKMPLISSEVIKLAVERRKKSMTQDASINTGSDHDVATELAKHVNTLRKISLIAEEFNQKTAKNLKEIVDSVQEDLIKKLIEVQTNKKISKSKPKDASPEDDDEI